jgi:allantoicase
MNEDQPFGRGLVNLAAPAHGAAVISVSDEFFAAARRMLAPGPPRSRPGRYDAHGQWMDGWESRRRRDGGHDACVLRICEGVVHGVEIDTRHFTGNFAPAASLEACSVETDPDPATRWQEILPRSALGPDRLHRFAIREPGSWTHLRLNLFPDGGIARLRIYGVPRHAVEQADHEGLVDLVCESNGGRALRCNDMHFGHMRNLVSPRPVANMGDGWETRRRREPGNDWVVLALGRAGRILRVEVDTAFFKGNHPARCSLKAGTVASETGIEEAATDWPVILPEMALGPDQLHVFVSQVRVAGPVSHVRFDIYPDGGVARLRLLGVPSGAEGGVA